MLPLPEVLRARRHRREVHERGCTADDHERRDHDGQRPATLGRVAVDILRAAAVRECREEVSHREEDGGCEGQRRGPNAVTDVSEEGDGEVEGYFGGDDYDVHLELGVAEAFLEEVSVEGVGGYGTGAEAGCYG